MSCEISGDNDEKAIDLIKIIEGKIKTLEKNNYGGKINDLSIIPIIVELSPELEEQGFFKERKQVRKKQGEVDYRLRISYRKFEDADDNKKTLLILKNVIESIRDVGKRLENFDSIQFEKDILKLFSICENDIENL